MTHNHTMYYSIVQKTPQTHDHTMYYSTVKKTPHDTRSYCVLFYSKENTT